MGDISKAVADTQYPIKKYIKQFFQQMSPEVLQRVWVIAVLRKKKGRAEKIDLKESNFRKFADGTE